MAELVFAPKPRVLAVKTLAAIEEAISKDQGNRFRQLLRELMPTAEDAYKSDNHGYRSHLGASFIGRECEREIWYGFRWTASIGFSGRMLRLFNRGHLEEPRFIALLRMIGCRTWHYDEAGKQFRVSYFGGHFGGSCDGVALDVPDDPHTPLLLEFKTHNDDSFSKLESQGVRASKFSHYVQMMTYMNGFQLRRALYMAVNKNTEHLYAELVDYDHDTFVKYYQRAHGIIFNGDPPKRVSNSPGWWACKSCVFLVTCHRNGLPERNCRTCAHVRVTEQGQWTCGNLKRCVADAASAAGPVEPIVLSKEDQLRACPEYRFNPKF